MSVAWTFPVCSAAKRNGSSPAASSVMLSWRALRAIWSWAAGVAREARPAWLADRYSLALQIFASLDAGMDHHNVPDVVLVAHEHDQVSARHHGVSDMGGANQSDVDLSRQHRLGSARSDNE